ncbi:MAG: signal peptide peptidase SppA [Caulobacteraceae bacterium]|nr:signal peptide peptidase SppA [Caulobacteraceae bacterium]
MKQFLLTMAGVFAGLVLFFIGLPFLVISAISTAAHPAAVPAKAVLTLDLRRGLTDQDAESLFASFGSHATSVMSVIDALHRAEGDSRVKALFVRLPEGGMEPAAADELRLAFRHFREAGKQVIVHSQGLYPAGAVTSTYMLGASADQLWMQGGAPFQATGLASSDIFFKRFFDKYGIKADFQQRYEYKNAVNGYLYDDYTAAHRLAQTSWMGSVYETAIAAAAKDRKLDPAALKALLEAGPYDAATAKAKGLIDRLGQVSEAQDAALLQGGDGAKLVDLDDYAAAAKADGAPALNQPAIAVVSAEGAIMTGPTQGGFNSHNVNSDDVAEALDAAAKDKSVKAIVFRISSPGGSDTASEQILDAVKAAKAQKPVVVSMGTYAASGGYWISSQASSIVAEPSTLTGSIGVYGGKMVLGPALARFGVDLRDLSVGGDYAGADSSSQEFTPKQRAIFAADIDRVYDGFIKRVADGRKLPADRVREIAKGRVWTGAQAKPLGLVDELGGFYQAVDKAKALAGLSGQEVRLKPVTAHRSALEALQKMLGVNSASIHALATAAQVLSDPRAQQVMDQVSQAQLRTKGADLLAPVPRF